MLNDETFEFGQARLKLKESLQFTLRQIGNSVSYLVEDEVTGRFFRLGLPQYVLLTMLDGKRTVSTALMKCATLLHKDAIDESEAATLCKWAIESGLVESETGHSADRRREQHQQHRRQKMLSWVNPLMLKIPLFNPDRFVSAASRYMNFLVSPFGGFVWLSVVIYGFLQLALHWNRFYTNRVESFGINDVLWIGLAWMVLKAFHEMAHALVCKKYGGRTQTCGLLLLMLIPMPFVDLTTSWRFDSKWQRIFTSAAGVMVELFLAAIACCVWVNSNPGPLQYHAGNLIITATLHTLLFNINPLMRFDGYYMLADYLEIPNLSSHGRQWLKACFKWLYFGTKSQPVKETGYRGVAVRIYGVLSMLWSFAVVAGLTLAAYSLVEGLGVLVAIGGVILWLGVPVGKLTRHLIFGTKTESVNRVWFGTAALATVTAIGCFLGFCPSPTVVSAPVVVDYKPLSVVRSRATGFAKQIHVVDGQSVSQGAVLMTLQNLELEHQLRSLLIDIEVSRLRMNALFVHNEISQVQLEQESLTSMLEQKVLLETHLANLRIVAPQSGIVIARDLQAKTGRYFSPGDELLSIGTAGKVHAIALAEQADIDWIEGNPESQVELLIWGRHQDEMIDGTISRIAPRARDDLPHEAFAASTGGALAVVSRNQTEGRRAETESAEDSMRLIEPRVSLEIALSDDGRDSLLAGQTGQLILRSRDENMGRYIQRKILRFVRLNTHRSHGL